MILENCYFINGTAYAGKSTMVKLLAEKYDGILCEENYHDRLLSGLDAKEFPCLTYTRDLEDWHDFIRRSPEEYEAWIDGVSKECEILELGILEELNGQGKPVFVDTNISVETLKEVAAPGHVLIMLADPQISADRFFERPDREKQFLYRLIMEEPDPEKAMENYRLGLMRINSKEKYDRFLEAGFQVIFRDESRSIEQTLALAERAFGLTTVEIRPVRSGDPLWEETIRLAENCSWVAGPRLARRMREDRFLHWEQVFAACSKGKVVGFCLFEEKGGVPDYLKASPFISCVFVEEGSRGQRISEKLVQTALDYAKGLGYRTVYLKSEHHGLYEKYGFTKIADFEPIRGLANQLFRIELS